MKRRNISAKKHGRSFQKKRNRTRAINAGRTFMRGGIRL